MDQNSNISMQSSQTVSVSSAERAFGYGTGETVRTLSARTLTVPFRTRFLAAELLGLLFVAITAAYIFALPSIVTRPYELRIMVTRFVKRTIDIIGAMVGLIISMPVMLIVALLIKLDSPGPVFYTQQRVGRNRRRGDRRYHQRSEVNDCRGDDRRKVDLKGKPFRVIKFRTMVRDAEKNTGAVWASEGDPRITRLGRILRKTRLDEVPQFFNVLGGDMSLVGPRPERPEFVRDLSDKVDGYTERLQVKPGITGLAQVEGGYDTSLESVVEKVGYDVAYIRSLSIWGDLKILAKTVRVVITGKGAH